MVEPRALALLRKYLDDRDETAAAFADRAGLDRSTFLHIRSGRRAPGLEIALLIEKASGAVVPVEAWVHKKHDKRRSRRAA